MNSNYGEKNDKFAPLSFQHLEREINKAFGGVERKRERLTKTLGKYGERERERVTEFGRVKRE